MFFRNIYYIQLFNIRKNEGLEDIFYLFLVVYFEQICDINNNLQLSCCEGVVCKI